MLDLRSPGEFAQGSFPGAINIPLMTDTERHLVGKCYKESGQDAAIELGHRLVTGDVRESRLQAWVEFARENPAGYIFCFRGGLRSRTVQKWLADRDVNVPLIEGGYKALRRFLIDSLEQSLLALPLFIIGGRTGSGKTVLLEKLTHHVDLEALAHHRGSSFGATTKPQPSNIDFENSLAIEFLRVRDRAPGPVFLEDEGRMIGRVCMPEVLRKTMKSLPVLILEAPLEERVEVSLQAYVIELQSMYRDSVMHLLVPGDDQTESLEKRALALFATHHRESLQKIHKRFGGENTKRALALFEAALREQREKNSLEGYRAYISLLLTEYYDPMYDYQIKSKNRSMLLRGNAAEIQQWITAQKGDWMQLMIDHRVASV